MAIREELGLIDKVSGPANKMAKSVDGVSSSAIKARSALAKLSAPASKTDANIAKMKASQDEFTRGVKRATDEMKKEHAIAKKAKKPIDQLPKPIKQATKEAKKLDAKDALGALGMGGAIGSGILTAAAGLFIVGKMVSGAVSGAISLAKSFTSAFIEAAKLRGESKAMNDTLTGGRGGEVMALLKKQSIATGQSIDDLQASFKKARDAGADIKDSLRLNLLRADIIASGRTAQEADSAIGSMLSEVQKGTKSAAKGTAELAKKFGVAGDGVAAVNKQATTFAGLMTRLKAAPGNILDTLAASSAGKKLDELGAKTNKFLNEWIKSGQAGAMINKITSGISTVISLVEKAAPVVAALWSGFKAGIAPVIGQLSTIGAGLARAFGGDKSSNMQAVISAANGIGKALGLVVGHAIQVATGFAAIVAAGAALTGWLAQLGGSALEAGRSIVDGIVKGILGGIGRAVDAAKQLASAVKGGLAAIIKPGSPSRMADKLGSTVPAGLARGEKRGMRAVEAVSKAMAVKAMPSNDNASAGQSVSRSTKIGDITVQVILQGSGSTANDAQSIGDSVISQLENYLLEAAV